jgi:serine phosphatase RsbU (regulator of sigma subunit)
LSVALVAAGELRELRVPGFALGVTGGRSYATIEAPFVPGAAAVLVTDGVLEQPNAATEAFDWPRFERVCIAASGSAEARTAAVVEAWNAHRGDTPPVDDATIVVLARRDL